LDGAEDEFPDGFADGDVAVAERIGYLDLWNAAARRGRREVGEAEAGEETAEAGCEDGPPDEAVAWRRVGAVDEEGFKVLDAEVEGYGRRGLRRGW